MRITGTALLLLLLVACSARTRMSGDVSANASTGPPSPAAAGSAGDAAPQARVALRSPDGELQHEIRVYDAADPVARARGLMGVSEMPRDVGMLFRFPEDTSGGFWMKDTLIPLTIAYAQADGTIVRILDMEPCRREPCPTYEPGALYAFAVEVNHGVLRELGVAEGWTMLLPVGLPPAS